MSDKIKMAALSTSVGTDADQPTQKSLIHKTTGEIKPFLSECLQKKMRCLTSPPLSPDLQCKNTSQCNS